MATPETSGSNLVPPERAHCAAVATTVPAVALYATPASQHASVDTAVKFSVKRWPGAAWCLDSCNALFTYVVDGTFVQNACAPDAAGKTP
jgi:hypothetical protein